MLQDIRQQKENSCNINRIIEENIPFIIKSISSVTGRYVSIENDEEFSVGLLAFTEAFQKYDSDKGEFYSFAKLVISSRVKNYLKRENKYSKDISIEEVKEQGIDISDDYINPIEDKNELIREIHKFKLELAEFNLTLEELADAAPKHKDTRNNAISISEKISKDEPITAFIFLKKRLPIKQISLKYTITEKVLKTSKKFILSTTIIFFRNYRNLLLWIKK